jgi:hypothetical protein
VWWLRWAGCATAQRCSADLPLVRNLIRPLLAVPPAMFVAAFGVGPPASVIGSCHGDKSRPTGWHPGGMAKEIDRVRAQSALAVIKQHPGMVLFVASPVIIGLGLVWWLVSPALAVLLFIGAVVGGGAVLLMNRK